MTAETQPSFERDIRPLFRDRDVRSMDFAFDLSNYDDVRENAAAIARRTAAGEMPCDAPWPADKVELFQGLDRGWVRPVAMRVNVAIPRR
jgi:hypothetical protein